MNEIPKRSLIRAFLEQPMNGVEIEARSMEIIDREAPPHPFPPGEWQIVRRMIHTVGDFGIIHAVRFSSDAVEAGIKALQACRSIYTDANMIRAGISLGVPFITTVGHRGGSPLAISVVHALCGMAAEGGEEEKP
jgi:precorrin isomerase